MPISSPVRARSSGTGKRRFPRLSSSSSSSIDRWTNPPSFLGLYRLAQSPRDDSTEIRYKLCEEMYSSLTMHFCETLIIAGRHSRERERGGGGGRERALPANYLTSPSVWIICVYFRIVSRKRVNIVGCFINETLHAS